MANIRDDVERMASCAVDALRGHPAGVLDFSRKSLDVIEAALKEAAPYRSEIQEDQARTLVQQFGCYILEVARREFDGHYLWHDKLQQPVLVVGEPEMHVAMLAWSKVQGRLAGDEADNIPFFYAGFAERVTNAQAGTHVLYV